MKFDNIFGNPPYQDNFSRGKTQHKTWISFTLMTVTEWCKEGGFIGWITPQSWASPSNKVLDILKTKEVPFLSMDTGTHFPDIGSTFSHYGIFNTNRTGTTEIQNRDSRYNLIFDDKVLYIPNDFCEQSYNIHKKVIFDYSEKLDVSYDYVTCHNVIRHAMTINLKKINDLEKKILNTNDCKTRNRLHISLEKMKSKEIDVSVSERKTETHIHPILHTNGKIWYSSKKQHFADRKKVMWSRSGYTKPFYDDGKLGCSDMGYYILVENEEQGQNLSKFLNSLLMQYIFRTAKWSGFGNEKVFLSLPKVSLRKELSDAEIYETFSLSQEEIEYIISTNKKKKTKSKSEIKSIDRVKEYGEIFTPVSLVQEVLSLLPDGNWRDPKQTFLDPSCGNGNFLVEILKRRLDSDINPEIALKTLFGVDIMQDNIDETKMRILELLNLKTNIDLSAAKKIVDHNIVCENSLVFDATRLLDIYLT